MNLTKLLNLKLYFVILLAGFLICIIPASAQNITTPEVYSFKQQAFSPVSYYTGQANISIPLYEIQTNEISIPITLDYIGGQGLQAINPYSSVGLGWRLTAGGAITRTINEVPDESIGIGGIPLTGFFNYVPAVAPITNDYVRNHAYSLLTDDGLGHYSFTSNYEYAPDIFTFSFLGYSGSFVMGYDGNFQVSSKDIVKVTKLNPSFSVGNLGMTMQFMLTANDGTIFTFGSTLGSIVYSGGESQGSAYQMDAWYLCNVTSPNGKSIDFTYLDNTWQTNRIHFKSKSDQPYASVTSFAILNKITYTNGQVLFTSTGKSQDIISGYGGQLKSVDNIVVQNLNYQTTRQVNFTYFSQQANRYYFLDSLKIDDKKYKFAYGDLGNLPTYGNSFGSDYWGFYNGQGEVNGAVTAGFRDTYLNQTLLYSAKLPNESKTKVGILSAITHPTGVTEYFTWEQNMCSRRGLLKLDGYSQNLTASPFAAGGLRIATISMGDQVKKYRYVDTFDPYNPDAATTSSGMLYKVPSVSYMNGQLLNTLSIEGEPPVTYYKVIEYLSDKSYTVFTMNSELDHPDVQNNTSTNYYKGFATNSAIFNTTNVPMTTFVGSLGKSSSCAIERGQMNKIEVYDSSNKLKRSTAFTYSQDPNRYSQYVSAICMVNTATQSIAGLASELGTQYLSDPSLYFSILHSYCIYTFPVFLTKEAVTDYSDNNKVVTSTTKYQYNAQKLKSSVISYDSKGDSITTTYKYPMDYSSTYSCSNCDKQVIVDWMKVKYMYSPIIEQQTLQSRGGVQTLIGGTINKFKIENNLVVPSEQYQLDLSSPSTNLTQSSLNGSGVLVFHPNFAKKLTYDFHDVNGYLLQNHKSDDSNTSYIWSYNGSMPVVKAENVTNTVLSAAVSAAGASNVETFWSGFNNIASDASQQAAWKNFNTALRNNSTLLNAQVSTYTYVPLIGMTSQTDPNGVTTYYEYDPLERLKNVRDKDLYILGRNYYHYYSDASSDVATLNVSQSTMSSVYTATSTQLAITANCSWTITSNSPSWLSVNTATGNLSGSVNVIVAGNTGILRTGILTVTYGTSQTKTVTVTQAANTTTLSTDQIYLAFPRTATTINVAITSNTTWTAAVSSGAVSWLRVSNVSGSGNSTLGVQTLSSIGSGSRSGYVTIATSDGLKSVQINVLQSY